MGIEICCKMNVLQLILFFCILNRLADARRVLNNRDRSSVNPLKGKHLRVMWVSQSVLLENLQSK